MDFARLLGGDSPSVFVADSNVTNMEYLEAEIYVSVSSGSAILRSVRSRALGIDGDM